MTLDEITKRAAGLIKFCLDRSPFLEPKDYEKVYNEVTRRMGSGKFKPAEEYQTFMMAKYEEVELRLSNLYKSRGGI